MPVTAVNTFSLRPGVPPAEFEEFSRTLDRPRCLALDVVKSFDVYVATQDGSRVDVVELMTVDSWSEWVAVRDSAPELEDVLTRFTELVDVDTVTTVLTRLSGDHQDLEELEG
jgi:hypothetical protein